MLPRRKKDRYNYLEKHISRVLEFIAMNEPCVVVGMGRLTCECLTGSSILKKKAGTSWEPILKFKKIGVKKVWIANSPDEALFNPVLCVSISRVLGRAAMDADIPIAMDYTLPMFDFTNYQ